MKLTALKTFRHGTQTFRRGAAVELSEAQAKPLIARKIVEESATRSKKAEPKTETAVLKKAPE